jgi:hypothetical protein
VSPRDRPIPLSIVTTVLFPLLALAAIADQADRIVGTWTGASTCVNREAAPACTDEQVIYAISRTAGKPGSVVVNADKVVNGVRVPMGALDFVRAPDGSWSTEIETPRTHALWRLTIAGDAMNGTLWLVPSKTLVRRVELRRMEIK